MEARKEFSFVVLLNQDETLQALVRIPSSPAMNVAEIAHNVHESSSVHRAVMMDRYLKDESASEQATLTVLLACASVGSSVGPPTSSCDDGYDALILLLAIPVRYQKG